MIIITLSIEDCGDGEFLVRTVAIDGTSSERMARGFDGARATALNSVKLFIEAEQPNPTPGKVKRS